MRAYSFSSASRQPKHADTFPPTQLGCQCFMLMLPLVLLYQECAIKDLWQAESTTSASFKTVALWEGVKVHTWQLLCKWHMNSSNQSLFVVNTFWRWYHRCSSNSIVITRQKNKIKHNTQIILKSKQAFTFSRHSYPEQHAVMSGHILIFCLYWAPTGIELTPLALQLPCPTSWATRDVTEVRAGLPWDTGAGLHRWKLNIWKVNCQWKCSIRPTTTNNWIWKSLECKVIHVLPQIHTDMKSVQWDTQFA